MILSLTLHAVFAGTSVVTITATDADDQTYGNSAKLVYSILQGQPYFSVDSENGEYNPVGLLGFFIRLVPSLHSTSLIPSVHVLLSFSGLQSRQFGMFVYLSLCLLGSICELT